MIKNEVFIVAAVRTPLGSFGGKLADFSATKLGSIAIRGALEKIGLNPENVDEVYFGNVVSANLGQSPARQAAIGAGIPLTTDATTINKVCASGMKSMMIGAQSIELGLNEIVVTGGMENMSQIPYYIPKARFGYKFGNAELTDGLVRDGLSDAYSNNAMGLSADKTAEKYSITREEQDEFAINSYKKVASATDSGKFDNEIIGVSIPQRKGDPIIMKEDEEYKNVMFDKIPTLKPVFSKEGTVTAANASTINDGAAAIILASADAVKKYKLTPLAVIRGYADAAHEPDWFTTAPTVAAPKALKMAGLSFEDIDLFEVNEAFAVVSLAFAKVLNIDASKMNIYGGAVAIGHPLGASGARIIATLVNALHNENKRYGLAAICNGGGAASSVVIERL
jgi:acetyl-CoA C-acetyltransferase